MNIRFGDAWFLTRQDVSHLMRNRETLLWTFLMPVVFFYFLGQLKYYDSSDRADPLAVSASPDAGFLADELTSRLQSLGYAIEHPPPNDFPKFSRRLQIPAGFTASILAGNPMKVRFTRRGDDSSADYDRVRIDRAVYTLLADLIAIRRAGGDVTPGRFRELAAAPRTLTLDVKTAGHRLVPPSGYEQSVPGTMVMFTLTVLFTAGAVSLTMERKAGILRRLAYTPISRGSIVLGKWGARMSLGSIQIVAALICGRLLFHVDWGPNLPMVLVLMLAYGSLVATLAMMMGNFGRSIPQVIGLGVTASNLLAGLGGCWWPVEVTPLWAQKLAIFLPTGWTMHAMHQLVNFNAPPAVAVPEIIVSLVLALAAGWVVARKFRFE
ncbi:MAG TPA: ABC transporter permease [Verrucomicrobiae bacterium]|nr:ABC transporter permease [Verrucomicrobiae bacterium]